jgi:hypothetical protein
VKPFTTKIRLILSAVVLGGAALVSLLEFSQLQRLAAVTLDGRRVVDPQKTLGLDPTASVLDQPLNIAARYLLIDDQTVRVDFDIALPASLEIRTNRFVPFCLVLDRATGSILGLNAQGRAVPLAEDYDDWQQPLITGVTANQVLQTCDDPRVAVIVTQLGMLVDENKELFRLIDEIDLSAKDCVMVTFSGLPYRLKVGEDGFFEQTTGFFNFVETYRTNVDSAGIIDLRYAGLIVQEAIEGQKTKETKKAPKAPEEPEAQEDQNGY